ncbi:WD40-repeat-containing domain protein [Limtongia smithiae]|uniref:WD40-repeat-containing domain protein n=1 Tax=Limtongia smithiae TaxID=1125753 RepID=UPI0034CF714A
MPASGWSFQRPEDLRSNAPPPAWIVESGDPLIQDASFDHDEDDMWDSWAFSGEFGSRGFDDYRREIGAETAIGSHLELSFDDNDSYLYSYRYGRRDRDREESDVDVIRSLDLYDHWGYEDIHYGGSRAFGPFYTGNHEDFFDPSFFALVHRLYMCRAIDRNQYQQLNYAATNFRSVDRISQEEVTGSNTQRIPWPTSDCVVFGEARLSQPRIDIAKCARKLRNLMFINPHCNYMALWSRIKREAHDSPEASRDEHIFRFQQMLTNPCPETLHFQLRHLLSPVTKNNIYYHQARSIMRLDSDTGDCTTVMAVDQSKTAIGQSTYISTLGATEEVAIACGLNGQYIYKNLAEERTSWAPSGEGIITSDLNTCTNHVELRTRPSVSNIPMAVVSCNDNAVRSLDLIRNQILHTHLYDFPVNCSATSPDDKLRIVAGDALPALIVDAASGKTVHTVHDHNDYIFSCAWSNNGYTIATGSQDAICQIYDVRNLYNPIHTVNSEVGIIRNIQFNKDGRFLAVAESFDHVHVLDTHTYSHAQNIEFWGSVSGIGFSQSSGSGDDSLWIANSDRLVGGIMQYDRTRSDVWQDLDNAVW